jgi:hypothetical protein
MNITLSTKAVQWSVLFYVTTLNLCDDVNCALVINVPAGECVISCRERDGVNCA